MKPEFVNVTILIPDELHDLALGMLYSWTFTGIIENFDEMIITFRSEDWNDGTEKELIETLCPLNPAIKITDIEKIEDQNWNEEWEKNVQSIIVSDKIGIAPEWKLDELKTEIKLIINPKMSFGTGEHATTRLMCIMLDKIVCPGESWLDIGTGTGVLAILSAKLGATPVAAIDDNYWSVENAIENFKLNDVADKISLEQKDINNYILPDVDGIVANLFSHLLIQNMKAFSKALKNGKGKLAVSGILKYHADDVNEAATETGFTLIETLYEDEWVAMHYQL